MKFLTKLIVGLIIILIVVLLTINFMKTKNNINSEIVNPASAFCIDNNGTLDFRQHDNGTFGVCMFEDGSECEEWMFYRGDCQKGEYIFKMAICTKEYNPVCAVNGVTYSNPCVAGEIPIKKKGNC